MNWTMRQMDSALGWYAEQRVWKKIILVVPIVLLVGVVVVLGVIAACSKRWTTTPTTADEVHERAQTIIEKLDSHLKETSQQVQTARDLQDKLGQQIVETREENGRLQAKVDGMSHEELKAFMRQKSEK